MATSLSQEDVNFLRLAGLLIRVAPRAVRRRFDSEFHPGQLKQFLSKNRGKIYDLTYKKRVITLVQYDLLFPKGSSEVTSDMFDVSLMVFLLRNLTDLPIQDGLPLETIQTVAADISRIKFYRNSIVHSDSGKINENMFSEIWEAIIRLAPEIKPEIDALIGSSLTNVKDIKDFIRLEKQLEKTNQHIVTINRKLETLEIEKNNITEIQQRTLKEWRNNGKKYIPTSATTFILESLNKTTGVIITGSPGCGKSAVAHHVALELEKEKYDIIPCDDPSGIIKHFTKDKFQVFVIDDVCGKFSLNQQKAESWEQKDCKLSMLIESCNLNDDDDENDSKSVHKFIITCRENIYVHETFPKLTCFSLVQCSFSTEYKITPEERRTIALSNNKFCIDELRSEDVQQLVNAICWECKIEPVSIVTIFNSFECLKGIYITESDDFYTAIHDKMFDIISAAIAPSIMKCLIQHVDIAFLANRTYISSFTQNSVPFVIQIPQEFESLFLQRQIKDAMKGKYWEVFGSIQTENEAYRKLLLSFLKEQDTCQQISFDFDEDGNTPLYVSSHLGYIDFVEHFVVNYPYYIEVKDNEGRSPFYVACEKGQIAVVRYLMKYNENIDTKNMDNTAALSATCLNGHTEVAQLLLDNKADINSKDTYGQTALHSACQNGHAETVKILMEFGMNVNQKNKNGRTPLYLACGHGCHDTVKYLLDLNGQALISRVDTTIKTEKGWSPLHIACCKGYLEIVKLLIDVGMNLNDRTKSNSTPLHKACQDGRYETVKFLLDLNCQILNSRVDTTIKNICGESGLHLASGNGHIEVVKLLVDVGMNLNDTTNAGSTPLHMACRKGQFDIVKYLLDLNGKALNSRVDTSIKETDGWSALHTACSNGHLEVVKLLIDVGMNLNDTTKNNSTPLHMACQNGHYETVKYLFDLNGKTLNSRVDTTIKNKDGWSALHKACFKGHLEVVKLLIDVGMNPNDTTNAGYTPLHMACQNDHYETVKFLLDLNGQTLNSRVDTTIKDKNGLSALHIACFKGHLEVVKLLIDVGMNLNDTTNAGYTPLHMACQNGHYETVKFLLDLNGQTLNSRVDTTIKDKNGWSVLHKACFEGYLEVAKLLIDVGMNLNDTTTINSTPLHMACHNGHYETVKYLLDLNGKTLNSGVDTTIKDKNGVSVLHIACFKGHLEVVKLLVDVGMNLNDTTNAGYTPLYQACRKGRFNIVKYLLDLNGKTLNSRVDTLIKGTNGWSALHTACFNGHAGILKLLICVGMDINERDNSGKTAVHLARINGHCDIVKILKDNRT
ncbi:unnamed protein product [Mytilus edulis]|uniref:DZIP3-like HEPN domain-containing protein n=1 Tax=Mytilus edulis TaxID=6550 RepID=A0A8S3VQY9_MYTED|nr:unnamed protein product [Mytilus edulis]